MLQSMTSKELAGWRAYERLDGPIGGRQDREILYRISDQLEQLLINHATAHGVEGLKFKPADRPWWMPEPEEETEEEYAERIKAEVAAFNAQIEKG